MRGEYELLIYFSTRRQTVMHPSGQTVAHAAHPIQFSGFSSVAKWQPRSFTSFGCRARTLHGQATTHRSQPLHLSWFISTAPIILAIFLAIHSELGESSVLLARLTNLYYLFQHKFIKISYDSIAFNETLTIGTFPYFVSNLVKYANI